MTAKKKTQRRCEASSCMPAVDPNSLYEHLQHPGIFRDKLIIMNQSDLTDDEIISLVAAADARAEAIMRLSVQTGGILQTYDPGSMGGPETPARLPGPKMEFVEWGAKAPVYYSFERREWHFDIHDIAKRFSISGSEVQHHIKTGEFFERDSRLVIIEAVPLTLLTAVGEMLPLITLGDRGEQSLESLALRRLTSYPEKQVKAAATRISAASSILYRNAVAMVEHGHQDPELDNSDLGQYVAAVLASQEPMFLGDSGQPEFDVTHFPLLIESWFDSVDYPIADIASDLIDALEHGPAQAYDFLQDGGTPIEDGLLCDALDPLVPFGPEVIAPKPMVRWEVADEYSNVPPVSPSLLADNILELQDCGGCQEVPLASVTGTDVSNLSELHALQSRMLASHYLSLTGVIPRLHDWFVSEREFGGELAESASVILEYLATARLDYDQHLGQWTYDFHDVVQVFHADARYADMINHDAEELRSAYLDICVVSYREMTDVIHAYLSDGKDMFSGSGEWIQAVNEMSVDPAYKRALRIRSQCAIEAIAAITDGTLMSYMRKFTSGSYGAPDNAATDDLSEQLISILAVFFASQPVVIVDRETLESERESGEEMLRVTQIDGCNLRFSTMPFIEAVASLAD